MEYLTPEDKARIHAEEEERIKIQAKIHQEIQQRNFQQMQIQEQEQQEKDKANLKKGCIGCLAIVLAPILIFVILGALLSPSAEEQTKIDQKQAAEKQVEKIAEEKRNLADREAHPVFYANVAKFGEPPDKYALRICILNTGMHGVEIISASKPQAIEDGWLISCSYNCSDCANPVSSNLVVNNNKIIRVENSEGSFAAP
jgi:hypothetical protein